MTIWALPENIEDVLPAEAKILERSRRIALDQFAAHGYELVMPPLLEYVESLLSGVGHDMDLATFKLVDQLSGRMMGIRADTTPQVARIDAHVLNRTSVTRLCYAGSVLHTRPNGLGKSREPFQVGAELYGHAGLDADIEVQQLMLDTLAALGLSAVKLDIGQPSIFRALTESAKLSAAEREVLFVAVSGKDTGALQAFAGAHVGAAQAALAAVAQLPTLYGDDALAVIARARMSLPTMPLIEAALSQLETVVHHFAGRGVPVSLDLGELGGFNYESGITFAAFAAGASEAVARGGRYDDIGRVFGRARPATGFSMDLKTLLAYMQGSGAVGEPAQMRILAPLQPDARAQRVMAQLRQDGHVVVGQLGDEKAPDTALTHTLVAVDGEWKLLEIAK